MSTLGTSWPHFKAAFKRHLLDNKHVRILLLPISALLILSNLAEVYISSGASIVRRGFISRDYDVFKNGTLLVISLTLGHYVAAWLYNFIFHRQLYTIKSLLLQKYLHSYIDLPHDDYHSHGTGKVSILINRQVESLCQMLELVVLDLGRNLVFMVLVMRAINNKFNTEVAVAFFIIFIVLISFISFGTIVLSRMKARHNNKENIVASKMVDILNNYNVIKAFNAENREIETSLSVTLKGYERTGKMFAAAIYVFDTTFRMLLFVPRTLLVVAFFFNKLGTNYNVEKLSVFFDDFGKFKEKTSSLKNAIFKLTEYYADVASCESIMTNPPMVTDSSVAIKHSEDIDFDNVSLQHDNQVLFTGFTLNVKKGEKIAITGRNGSGKSTILKTMLGFSKYSGSITVDGAQISNINEKALRELISYVPQNPHILNTTVMDNLLYGAKDMNQSDVMEACIRFRTHALFKRLPNGYHTNVGESGKYLSGGQCQILNFMRAVIKNAPIFLLDEPTSNLDYSASEELLDVLFENLKDKTVFLTTHNPYHLSRFDKIINIKDGKVNVFDSFDEFKESCGGKFSL